MDNERSEAPEQLGKERPDVLVKQNSVNFQRLSSFKSGYIIVLSGGQ